MKLQTRIQFSTTVVLMIMLIAANTSIYFIFKNNSISSEQNRLTNTLHHIVKEMATNKGMSMEQILEAYLISDGMIRVVNSSNSPARQMTTDSAYWDIPSNYKDDQFEEVLKYNDSMFVIVSIPALDENGEVVNLQVIENINHLYENILHLKWVLVFTAIIVNIILFTASGILGRFISLPIQRLIQTMKMIEDNESYEKIEMTSNGKDELTEMAMTFNRMITKLEKSYLKQEQFVADASHELKTPLTVISSYVKLLKRWGTERPEILKEAIDSIESESSRMKYLTEQLLQLARSEEAIENEKVTVNIVHVVEETIQRLQRTFEHEIRFFHQQHETYFKIHKQSFVQLLVIFLDNAKKYSDDNIDVYLEELDGNIKISVKDRGVGIPPENQVNVFDRLYRVDKTRSRKTGGSGLGLSIAKRIVEQHGGEIYLESAEGEGTTFIVKLPKQEV
ncbi:HAMP domain-containing histidine kinase [Siminovitchia acidinfaciens]|uniref:histidine kinase n=1 Tax=Siminovitchia acidinfaciens TaxID=2321395 RepID=A0A429XVH1_9BACI|nr:HAMP domain-containing sensor histidine kinase [Siminovitchia acidinfaciens]RST72264.1 HAMP domain-containing histidine kinase [Siminovitchia acidinfaciens]